MILKEISGKRPAIGKGNFIAENAVLATLPKRLGGMKELSLFAGG